MPNPTVTGLVRSVAAGDLEAAAPLLDALEEQRNPRLGELLEILTRTVSDAEDVKDRIGRGEAFGELTADQPERGTVDDARDCTCKYFFTVFGWFFQRELSEPVLDRSKLKE